jgi:hypothetical protein
MREHLAIAPGLHTPQGAAKNLAEYAKRRGFPKPRHPFPYKRWAYHDPSSDKVWWVGPERGENPAYWRGKIVWRSNQVGSADVFIGFYAERGLAPESLPLPEGKQRYWVMKTPGDWVWPTLLQAVSSSEIEPLLEAMEGTAKVPVTVVVYAGRPHDRASTDEFAGFNWSSGRLNPMLELRQSGPGGLLKHIYAAASLSALGAGIKRIPDYPSTWVDLQAGFTFQKGEARGKHWTEREVWTAVVEPWLPWIR